MPQQNTTLPKNRCPHEKIHDSVGRPVPLLRRYGQRTVLHAVAAADGAGRRRWRTWRRGRWLFRRGTPGGQPRDEPQSFHEPGGALAGDESPDSTSRRKSSRAVMPAQRPAGGAGQGYAGNRPTQLPAANRPASSAPAQRPAGGAGQGIAGNRPTQLPATGPSAGRPGGPGLAASQLPQSSYQRPSQGQLNNFLNMPGQGPECSGFSVTRWSAASVAVACGVQRPSQSTGLAGLGAAAARRLPPE